MTTQTITILEQNASNIYGVTVPEIRSMARQESKVWARWAIWRWLFEKGIRPTDMAKQIKWTRSHDGVYHSIRHSANMLAVDKRFAALYGQFCAAMDAYHWDDINRDVVPQDVRSLRRLIQTLTDDYNRVCKEQDSRHQRINALVTQLADLSERGAA